MEVTRNNLLLFVKSGLKRKNLSIAGLEKQSGVPKDTVRDFLRGKTQILRADKLQKIMRVLQPQKRVAVIGYVGKAAEIFAYDPSNLVTEVDCPPGMEPLEVLAVRVESDAMMPVFQQGWIIYYSETDYQASPPARPGAHVPYNKSGNEPLAEYYNKPCIVHLKDGGSWLRTLKPGSMPKRYHLIGYNTPDIKDAEVESVTKIIFIKIE